MITKTDFEKLSEIKHYFAEKYSINVSDLDRKIRKRHILEARQSAHYAAKLLTKASLTYIGFVIGSKDHATVLHSCKTVSNLIDTEIQFKQNIELYIEELRKILSREPARVINIRYMESKALKYNRSALIRHKLSSRI